MSSPTGYILGISRGHNAGVCLLKDGKIVFAIEEERFSRIKYDGGPFAAMRKVLDYTNKVDYIFVSHTQSLESTAGNIDYTGDNIYTGFARKLGLIESKGVNLRKHPQVIDLSHQHHKIHAACAFYRSGFNDAVAVVVDGAGSVRYGKFGDDPIALWEVETILDCGYPANFKTLYKHSACRDAIVSDINYEESSEYLSEEGTHVSLKTGHAGITKTYEAVTEYCGFQGIEAGKTMGLFPYGKPNPDIPNLFNEDGIFKVSNRNLFTARYPGGAIVNSQMYDALAERPAPGVDITTMQNRRDLAYALQKQTQEQVLDIIISATKLANKKQVVFSGGYALNCVANYYFLDRLNKEDIELYVEPISNDGGTAIGVALWGYYELTQSTERMNARDIYLGPEYFYSEDDIATLAEKYGATIKDANDDDVIEIMRDKNIVALFQGRSENGPRALGNRSLLFDPTFKDGKDFVNLIKKREYFRPFAGSILAEDVHEWFDLRGMQDSPHMMYAVNCKEGIEEKIPSIIHVDGTCRIQTVSKQDNPIYHRIISRFKEKTGVPIVFNTSFNLGGEPLVETLEDALWTLQQSDIQYLYLPEYNKLLTVHNFSII
jgi:carbamoyltransferase